MKNLFMKSCTVLLVSIAIALSLFLKIIVVVAPWIIIIGFAYWLFF